MVTFKEYSFKYNGSDKYALSKVNFSISAGQIAVICGASGSGKTTLLKTIKDEISPIGEHSGSFKREVSSADVAMVFQNPEIQMVTGSVISDLAFQMENLGFKQTVMQKRLAETVGFFGLEELLHKSANQLSGGQKQLIALCAALMTRPKLLLLDEPISQLDPIAATEFLDMIKRINDEFGITVIMTQHRLDEAIAFADRVLLLDKGSVMCFGEPANFIRKIWDKREYCSFIPSIPKTGLILKDKVVLTPKEFRTLELEPKTKEILTDSFNKKMSECVAIKNLLFAYENSDFVLKNLDFRLYKGEILCLVGGNGSGKTTLLKAIAKIVRPYMGKIKHKAKKIGYMPQNPCAYFMSDSVRKELNDTDSVYFNEVITTLELRELLDRHPYDLSGGEQQKVVLASIMLNKPELILLDEPVKGLDPISKAAVSRLLKESGATIVLSTHDLEFAAKTADRCAMLFDGSISIVLEPRQFFSENRYYTTPINKAAGQIFENAVLLEDVLYLCQIKKPYFI